MTKNAELTHLFRQLKSPAAARAFPALAERARQEEWSYERFAEALARPPEFGPACVRASTTLLNGSEERDR